ncbi:DNA cytosine methyltransferase [Comamonas testosteroni]|uniref:DNA cytosine methyltransferase n=1 Tax=Comamonas testosteroni TaxID=285 RepID=UPI0006B9F4DA|nr:DNA cytosine methyltransferase [Comamonas testosteroni]
MITKEIKHFHLFCGLGGGARGFNRASPRVGNLQARFRCIGGIDVDSASIRDFGRLTGVPGTVLDLFDREQYRTFHGSEPPADWQEATAADIQHAASGERPHIVFLSAPCKGFSGLLSEGKSKTDKYQALNRLTLRGVWLMLEAWHDDPPELIIFENVPRIATRGRHLLDQIVGLLRSYGYAVAETTHDCGEIGGLAQSRKRFLLVARHIEKVPPFLYQPDAKPLRAVGDVLGRMLLPGDLRAGPMHRVPSLQWKTWVRLAFVEAGSDWRSLNRLAIEDGQLRDFLIVPEMRGGMFGVQAWDQSSTTVAGRNLPTNGNFSVADPRFEQSALWKDGQAYGVRRWDGSTGTVAGQQGPGQGAYSVADPRHHGPAKHSNEFRIVHWDRATMAVTSAHGTGQAVADPRGGPNPDLLHGKYPVTPWAEPSRTVIAGNANGAFAVADPRPGMRREAGDHYLTGGHYGVVPWESSAGAVSAAACHDNGRWTVADPRAMPAPAEKLVCRIVAEDGTWHRPFTTLELAALQSLVDPEEMLELDGLSDQAWRERIGNAVPSAAGEAIAHVMGETLLLAWAGETFLLSAQPIWVRPIAVALTLPGTAA